MTIIRWLTVEMSGSDLELLDELCEMIDRDRSYTISKLIREAACGAPLVESLVGHPAYDNADGTLPCLDEDALCGHNNLVKECEECQMQP